MMDNRLTGEEEEGLIELTKELIRIPSSVRDGKDIFDHVASFLREHGLNPHFQQMNSPYMEYQDQSNLLMRVGDGSGPRVMLNCHLDTVEFREGWLHQPFGAEEDSGRIFGLGAADMKGGSAAAIFSALTLATRLKQIRGELLLTCVFGEEAPFSLGADTLLREYDFVGYDLIIVTEPSPLLAVNDFCSIHQKLHKTSFPTVIVGAEGRILFELEFFGRSTHASHPSQGVNALHDAAWVIEGLADFNTYSDIKMGRGHYVVLNIEGGDQTFTVPGYCKILVNRQLTLGETEKSVTVEIKKLIKSLRLRTRVTVQKRYAPSPEVEYRPYISEDSPYIDWFMEGLPTPAKGKRCRFTTSSVGDFNLFGTRTKAPVLVFGPGGGNIHSADEYVNKQDVIDTTNYLLAFLMEVFG
jgi:succinyl-diaminopimelate desuccinylase